MSRKRRKRKTKTKESKRHQRGGAWKSSLSPKSRRPSWRRIPGRRPRCRSGSSPSQRPRGIESARSKTRRWNWKQNPSLPTAAISAQKASRSPVTLSGIYHTYHTPTDKLQITACVWKFIYLEFFSSHYLTNCQNRLKNTGTAFQV